MSNLLNNRYQILQPIAAGAFGNTFLAEDTHSPARRQCVVKQLKLIADPALFQIVKERFEREAALLEILGESNNQIPKLFAYFSEAGQFHLVQEWIKGKTLARILFEEKQISPKVVKEILISLLPVLEYIHSQDVIHRDIKPDNIIVREKDGKPVLIDFGVVKERIKVDSFGNPISSIIAGTPDFMAFEQVAGKPVFASDLYSLGMTAICLLTGKSPKEMVNQLTGDITWREYALSVDDNLAAILDKAMKYDFRDRYQTAREMLSSLEGNGTPGDEDETTIIATQPNSGSSSEATIVDQLPSSNPATRALVDQSIKEMVANSKGSMGSFWVESPNAMTVWRSLNGQLCGNEISELCHILNEVHEWDVYWKAITLLSYSVVKPEGKPFQSIILAAISNHIAKGGYLQTATLNLAQKLSMREEVWKCLLDSLLFVQGSRDAYEIVKIIGRFTPPDKREQTGAVILELFSLSDDNSYVEQLLKAIEELDYRQAIPILRDIFSYVQHYKILCSAQLLAKWQDKGSIPVMRRYIDAIYRTATSDTYTHVLKALYKIEGSDCASYVANILLNSPASMQRSMYYTFEEFKNEPVVIEAARKLVETTSDVEVKKNIGAFLERNK